MSLVTTLTVAASLLAPRTHVRVGDPLADRLVREAALAASRMLATAECQQVLSDFEAYVGGELQATLQERQATPESYMQQIVFYDGSRNKRCAAEGVLAFTAPGSFVVFVCPAELKAQARRGNYRLIEASLIHEMLHSLGLGENPPSAREITRGVLARCR
jgi:hypothetical protein